MNFKISKKNNLYGAVLLVVVFVVISGFFTYLKKGSAVECQNNICKSSVFVGGEEVSFYYTERLSPAGFFKIRFISSAKEGYVLQMLTGFPSKPTVSLLGNPESNNPLLQSEPEITASNNVIMEGNRTFTQGGIDYVVAVKMDNLESGQVLDLGLDFVQNGANAHQDINIKISDIAPLNNREVTEYCRDYPDNDPLWGDNDLDYFTDCRDSDCDNIVGNPNDSDFCSWQNEQIITGEEDNCYDRFDNDFDRDGNAGWDYDRQSGLDCRDLDCDGGQGDADGNLCWFNNSNNKGEGEAKGYPESCRDGFNNDSDDGSGNFVSENFYYDIGYTDCFDLNCWRMGDESGDPCPNKENLDSSWCVDGIDNDFDDGINLLDKNNSTGRDCLDYDCANIEYGAGPYFNQKNGKNYTCPFNEVLDINGKNDPARCFDGIDNDLDACEWSVNIQKYVKTGTEEECNSGPGYAIDCGDPDCLGIENPNNPGEKCFPNEFEIGKYQFCWDDFDNDGDDLDVLGNNQNVPQGIEGGTSCEDNRNDRGEVGDCWQRFGNCGPCPVNEDLAYNSCADQKDNDLDGQIDCADSNDCRGEIGRLRGAALCVASGEEVESLCFDGLDNDASGKSDCADVSCVGAERVNPYGIMEVCGAENSDSSCSDGFDNDGDGTKDCLDPDCAGKGDCSIADWQQVSCTDFPREEEKQLTNSIQVLQYSNIHINNNHRIEISGGNIYSDLLIIVGSKTNIDLQYPYELSRDNCDFTLPDNIIFIEDEDSNYHYGKFQQTGEVSSFNLIIECSAVSVPHDPNDFSIKAVTNTQAGPEIGGQVFTVQAFEDKQPVINKIEVEGMRKGVVEVPYNQDLTIRGITEGDDSGICACVLDNFSAINNIPSYDNISNGDCQFNFNNITNDDAYDFTVNIEDGAGNQSNNCLGIDCVGAPLIVDVVPIVESPLILDHKDKDGNDYPAEMSGNNFISPFYKRDDKLIVERVDFRTAENESFPDLLNPGGCSLLVKNDDEEVVYSDFISKEGEGSVISCRGVLGIESLQLRDGRYYISVGAIDEDNYTIESPWQVFYVCGENPLDYPEGHACRKADFDQDGAVEGIRAKASLYGGGICSNDSSASCITDSDCADSGQCLSSLVCDNCPNIKNLDQADSNANGFGDLCEPRGFCTEDGQPCIEENDCSVNLCQDNNTCVITGEECQNDSDCSVNYCNDSAGRCSGSTRDICLIDEQCSEGTNCNNNGGGYCERNSKRICFQDTDCLEECVEGVCEIQGISCTQDSDCEPSCKDVNNDPDIEEYRCSNNSNKLCDPSKDPRQQCLLSCSGAIGICDNDSTEACLTDGDCDNEGQCVEPKKCSDSEVLCNNDTDCRTGEICEQKTTKEQCSGSGEACQQDSDCESQEVCQAGVGVCSINGQSCSNNKDCSVNLCDPDTRRCSLDDNICVEDTDCVKQVCEKNIGRCEEDESGSKLCLTDNNCAGKCLKDNKLCDNENAYCLVDGQCFTGECRDDFGTCDNNGALCVSDINCSEGGQCEDIGFPWLETRYGSIYTRKKVEAVNPPPQAQKYTATYCIFAGNDIDRFSIRSGISCLESGIQEPFNYPGVVSKFQSVIGRIDLTGIEAGQYGTVQAVSSANDIPPILKGKVYVYRQSEVNQPFNMDIKQFNNGSGGLKGSGLVLVYGDVYINGNIIYGSGNVENLNQLASLGWIVLDDPATPEKEGNLFINASVTKIVGAFFVENAIDTGKSFKPLTVNGLMVAHQFLFQRFFASMERGSEQIIYDGRAQASPPPGMADLTKALPNLESF